MLLFLGDIHGDVGVLKDAIDKANEVEATALIQVGDFGLFERNGIDLGFRRVAKKSKVPVYFIEGNHDDCKRWTMCTEVTKIYNDANLFYIPRGTVMELDGRTLAFLGGAGSIDKAYRLRYGMHWDEYENISPQEVLRLLDNAKGKKIDVLVTHCPPNYVIEQHFDPRNKLFFGVDIDWKDHNQDIVENVWKALGYPYVLSGHMHKSVKGFLNESVEEGQYRILNINELLAI